MEIDATFPKIFLDTSRKGDIDTFTKFGIVKGITTNPVIVAEDNPQVDIMQYYTNLAKLYPDLPISIQLPDIKDYSKLADQARAFAQISPDIVVKVPMFNDYRGIKLISDLTKEGVKTNITALMSSRQALLALIAAEGSGPNYVSLFFNRMKDGDEDPKREIGRTREVIERFHFRTEIITGSIRSGSDVVDAFLYGAHIVTVPPKILSEMLFHQKTQEFIDQCQEKLTKLHNR